MTEAAALAAARWVGRGEKEAADRAAVDAMRLMLDTVPMDGIVVIGEGEKDEAPMLYNGEQIGDGSPPEVDIAVDPLEGTTLTARGHALGAGGDRALRARDDVRPRPLRLHGEDRRRPRRSPTAQPRRPARRGDRPGRRAQGRRPGRRDGDHARPPAPRGDAIEEIREAGARIRFITDGDVSAALLRGLRAEAGVDLLWGIGGTPEGVLSAAAIKCMGGQLLGRLWPRDDDERQAAIDAGYDLDEVLDVDRLVSGDDVFFAATGVTDGDLLQGVRYCATARRRRSRS